MCIRDVLCLATLYEGYCFVRLDLRIVLLQGFLYATYRFINQVAAFRNNSLQDSERNHGIITVNVI